MKQVNDLLTALREGDPGAFKMMYDQYYPLVVKIASRYLTDPSAINSVVNDAFLKLWDFGGNLSSEASFPAWLHIITRNLCIDVIRREKAVRNVSLEFTDAVPEPAEEMVFTTQLLLEIAILQEAYRVIESLPPLQRNVLQLYFIENKTIAEIAELLGKTSINIRNAKVKGLQRLREIMQQRFQHTDYNGVIWPIILLVMVSIAGS